MKDRIKKIRKEANLTQEAFAKKAGVKRNTVTSYEKGIRTPGESVITLICSEFGIRREWLLNGTGEMYDVRTKETELIAFANRVAETPENSIQKRFVCALAKLDVEDWEKLQEIINEIQDE